jgi:hypothetical protein
MQHSDKKRGSETPQHEASATSKATLEEIEKSEADSNSSNAHDADQAKVPSPDGSFDENKELRDTDPM